MVEIKQIIVQTDDGKEIVLTPLSHPEGTVSWSDFTLSLDQALVEGFGIDSPLRPTAVSLKLTASNVGATWRPTTTHMEIPAHFCPKCAYRWPAGSVPIPSGG